MVQVKTIGKVVGKDSSMDKKVEREPSPLHDASHILLPKFI